MLTLTPPTTPPQAAWRDVIYPDSDGIPMANNQLHLHWICFLIDALKLHFRDRSGAEPVAILGDMFWYPVEGNNKIFVAPDVMLAFGRPPLERRRSYQQWEEGGIPPQVVFEILSPSNTASEMLNKLSFFDTHGVEEYYIYDCEELTFRAYVRDKKPGSALVEVREIVGWYSPRLGVGFELDPEGKLRLYTPDGRSLVSWEEKSDHEQARADKEKARAEQEKALGEKERARADQEKARADRLAALLAAAGIIDPGE